MNWRCCWPTKKKEEEEKQPFKIGVKEYYNIKFKTA